MTEKELKIRTRKFAVEIFNFVDKLPNRRSAILLAINLAEVLRQLQLIIGLPAEADHMQSLLQKLA